MMLRKSVLRLARQLIRDESPVITASASLPPAFVDGVKDIQARTIHLETNGDRGGLAGQVDMAVVIAHVGARVIQAAHRWVKEQSGDTAPPPMRTLVKWQGMAAGWLAWTLGARNNEPAMAPMFPNTSKKRFLNLAAIPACAPNMPERGVVF